MNHAVPTLDPVLQHLDWVRALSLSLVRDAAAADDVVQDVWLVAQSRMPSHLRETSSVRSWLAGVARNVARNQRRSEARRRSRETAQASPEAAPSSLDLLARSEQLNRVAQLVLELDEPFRRTMLMHWFEGRSTVEIATLDEVRPATVYTRLHRGKEQLRERLDGENGGESRDWALALVPSAARALATGSGKKLTGAKGVAVAAALLVGMTAGAIGLARMGSTDGAPGALASDLVLGGDQDHEQERSAPPARSLMDSRIEIGDSLSQSVVPKVATNLQLNVLALRSNGEPAADLSVGLRRPKVDGTSEATGESVKTDAAGRATFAWERVVLHGAHEAGVSAQIAGIDWPVYQFEAVPIEADGSTGLTGPNGESLFFAPPTEPFVIRLPPTSAIEVRTWLAPGEPLSTNGGISLRVPGDPRNWTPRQLTGGVARFNYVAPHPTYTVKSDTHPLWETQRVDGGLQEESVLQVDLFPSPTAVLYSARLVSGTAEPLANFWIRLGLSERGNPTSVQSDASGRIVFGLPADDSEPSRSVTVEPRGWGVSTEQRRTLDVPTASGGQRLDLGDIVLEKPTAWCSGSVVDPSGSPIENAIVTLEAIDGKGENLWQVHSVSSTSTDSQGTFWLPAPNSSTIDSLSQPDRTLRLRARGPQYETASIETGVGPLMDLRLVLSPMREVSLRVHDMGRLADDLRIAARRPGPTQAQPLFLTRPVGSREFRAHLPTGTWTLAIHSKHDRQLPILEMPPFVVKPLGSDELDDPIELALPDVSLEGNWRMAVLRFEDGAGTPIKNVSLSLSSASMKLEGRCVAQGEITLVLPSEPVTITTSARGYQGRTFTLIGIDQTIMLEAK